MSRRIAIAVVSVAVAGGGLVMLRPGDDPSGRVRHGRSGALAAGQGGIVTDENTPEAAPGISEPGSSDTTPESSAPGATAPGAPGGRAPGTAAAAGTTGGSPTTGAAGEPSTTTGADGRGTTRPAPKPPANTSPAGGGTTTAPAPANATAGPGWQRLPNAPISGRADHTAVWTGREMVIWGGTSDLLGDPLTDGAAFDPVARTWRKVSPAPLSPRLGARAFWTGSEMVVYGGSGDAGFPLGDGAAWSPASDTWRPIPTPPIGARDTAVVAWAGDRLVVWGGSTVLPDDAPDDAEAEMRNDGAAWVAATGHWVSVAVAPLSARNGSDWAWIGNRLMVTGGYTMDDDEDRRDGAALDPASGTWSPVADRPKPAPCGADEIPCGGVWTGALALFPGVDLVYDPSADRWSTLAPFPGNAGHVESDDTAVWTGRTLLVWGSPEADSADDGGEGEGDDVTADDGSAWPSAGFSYDPAGNAWKAFAAGPLSGRDLHTAVWTGQEMLVWGGTADDDANLADGAAYRPEAP